MRIRAVVVLLLLTLCVAGMGFWRALRIHARSSDSSITYLTRWNPEAATHYLDERQVWWQNWPPAQMDQGTICISCHTVVPYALARPGLQQQLGRTGATAAEQTLMNSVEKRVGNWSEMRPFYSDAVDGPGKTAESRATEAVLNAVILTSYDARHGQLRPITRTALDHAWALQEQAGANAGGWKWQDFHLAPWESSESAYQGAALLAIALGNAPDRYVDDPAAGRHVQLLQEYLRRQYAAQPLMSQLYVLWASARMPGLLSPAERTQLLGALGSLQHRDGGWTLFALNKNARWRRLENTSASDGCATALAVLALEESGVDRSNRMLDRGIVWLERHQATDGSWRASSLNVRRDPNSDIGRFMSDAATGYAVLALEIAGNL